MSVARLIQRLARVRCYHDAVCALRHRLDERAKLMLVCRCVRALHEHRKSVARGEARKLVKTLVYVNSGHNPPLLCTRKDGIRLLEDGSTVLGAMHPLPFLKEGFITDLDDFLLFCYTDGLTETLNESGEEYGQQGLIDYFNKNSHKDLKTIHQDIIVALDGFKGKNSYRDDITMLSCRVG